MNICLNMTESQRPFGHCIYVVDRTPTFIFIKKNNFKFEKFLEEWKFFRIKSKQNYSRKIKKKKKIYERGQIISR